MLRSSGYYANARGGFWDEELARLFGFAVMRMWGFVLSSGAVF